MRAHEPHESTVARARPHSSLARRATWVPLVLVSLASCREPGPSDAMGGVPRETSASAPHGPASSDASAAAPTASASPASVCEAHIVFVSERDENREIYAICADGTQSTRLTRTPDADEFVAAVMPDRMSLVLVVSRGEPGTPTYTEELARLSFADGAVRPLVPRGSRARSPSVFPDGSELVFEAGALGFSNIALRGASGAVTRIEKAAAGSFEPAASPDGARIAYVSSREGNAEIFTMGKDGKDVRRLTWQRGEDTHPVWSPDGRALAFVSSRGGAPRLHTMGPAGETPRALGAKDLGVLADRDPRFSPDGARIAYSEDRGKTAGLRIVDARTGALVVETHGAHRDESPEWSPDGQSLVFSSNRDGDVELYRMRHDGTGVSRLTRSRGADWLPRWVR